MAASCRHGDNCARRLAMPCRPSSLYSCYYGKCFLASPSLGLLGDANWPRRREFGGAYSLDGSRNSHGKNQDVDAGGVDITDICVCVPACISLEGFKSQNPILRRYYNGGHYCLPICPY